MTKKTYTIEMGENQRLALLDLLTIAEREGSPWFDETGALNLWVEMLDDLPTVAEGQPADLIHSFCL